MRIKEASGNIEQTRQALSSARLVLRIFFSLNSPGLTEVRESSCTHLNIREAGRADFRMKIRL